MLQIIVFTKLRVRCMFIQPIIHIIFNCINFSVARIKQEINIAIPEYQFWLFYT